MRHPQKGAAAPWIIAAVVILIILLLFFLFHNASAPTSGNGSAPTNGFTPLDSSGNPFVTGVTSNGSVDNSFPATATPAQAVTNAPTQTYAPPPAETPPPQQTYQIQTSAPAPIISTPFVTNVVTASSPDYAPSAAPNENYTYTIPTIAYTPPTYPTQSTTTSSQGSGGSTGGVSLDEQIFGYVSGLGWTQLLGGVGQDIFNAIYDTSPGGTTGATLGHILPGGSSVFGSGGGGGGGGFGGGGGGGGGAAGDFGGQITQITYCTCAASMLLGIKDVRGQTVNLFYQYGASQLYANYDIFKNGVNVLGNYKAGGGSCMVYVGEGCTSEGSGQGTITMIGTSQ